MNAVQRAHLVGTVHWMKDFKPRLLYPWHDQRDGRDGFFWSLTESRAHTYLQGGGSLQFDCSEFVPWLLRCAGCWHWDSPGFTGSHLQMFHNQVYTDPKQAYPGAIVIFGQGDGHHEAVVIEADHEHGNPLLASHGRPGLDLVRLADMASRQPPGVRLISVLHL